MPKTKYFIATAIILTLTAVAIFTIGRRGVPVVVKTNLENIPMQIGDYQGREDSFPQSVYDELQADLHVYRQYEAVDGRALSLYIGYYGTAKGGRTGHNPFACLPGAGWGIVESGKVKAYPSYASEGVELNYVVAAKDGVKTVMLHWYQTGGDKVLATGLQQNIDRFVSRALYNRNDGAFVQVNAVVKKDDISVSKEMIAKFSSEVLEILPKHWPEEF